MAKKNKKSSASSTPKPEDLSASCGKKGKKGKKGSKEEVAVVPEDSKEARRAQQQAHRAKVTSTASWTGKLPHTLLHEYCQKKKWNKVDYDMKKIGDKGMIATAVVSYTDPKSKEVLKIRLNDPTYDKATGKGLLVLQETPAEARHMAATVGLCRIAYNTNLHMMLPPNHKNLWYDLSDYRKKLIAEGSTNRADRIFDNEPFVSLLENRKHEQQKLKEQEAKENQREKIQTAPVIISSSKTSSNSPKKVTKGHVQGKKHELSHSSSPSLIRFPKKVWENATFIDLDESTRQLIESSMKSHVDWKSKRIAQNSSATGDRTDLKNKLSSLNFRSAHITEAMNYKDPLSFLLFNLPEDDLPNFFQRTKEDSKNKVEISSLPLTTRMIVERLTEGVASNDEALYALERSDMDENEAAGILTEELITQVDIPQTKHVNSNDESIEIWNQELESIKCIYEDIIEDIVKDTSYTIIIDKQLRLKVKVYRTKNYPNSLPGIIVSTFDKKYKLPNYIKKQILTKLLDYIIETNLLGEMLIYNVFEWLQENIKTIIDNPGPLLPDDALLKSTSNRGSSKNMINKLHENNNKHGRSSRTHTMSKEKMKELYEKYVETSKTSSFKTMQEIRNLLPASKKRDIIVDMVEKNDAVLITGETGSGKSTQVVQFLLDALQKKGKSCNIICTQPRRISAIGLAERVSDERCVNCGDEVGYIIRGVNKTNANTQIKFMTTGVLVRILQSDKTMLNNSIVVIDEVHERSIDTDLIVTLLKNLLGKVPGMKIVLMSATVNVNLFKSFFPNLDTCHIEGRTFPIKDYFLDDILPALDFKIKSNKYRDNSYDSDEDTNSNDEYIRPGPDSNFFKSGQINYDLVCDIADHVNQELHKAKNDGSIIIFLPGIAEIDKCCRMLQSRDSDNSKVILPLHSALTPEDQKKVFRRYKNKRKIVVSTNIAETSITIDDCVATIDSGRAKTMYYNPKDNTTRLTESFISKAEAKQRRGRAGRVREGLSYKLYSKRLFEEDMVDMPAPEIKRVSLESLYLSVKAMGIKNVTKFLASGLECPPLQALQKAERMLTTVGLLEETDQSLTELGRFISLMPVMDSKHGKLLIYSIIFGMTDVGVLAASILSSGSLPFIGGIDNRDSIRKVLSQYKSRGDLLAVVEIMREYLSLEDKSNRRQFLKEHMLSYNKVSEIMSSRVQYYSVLKDIGFLPFNYKPGDMGGFNKNSENLELTKAILTGAYYPNVARVQLPDKKFLATSAGAIEKDPEAKLIKYWIRNEEYVDKLTEIKEEGKGKSQSPIDRDSLPLPSSRAFIHPSSILFQSNTVDLDDMKALDDDDNDNINNKYVTKNPMLKLPFVLFNSSHVTNKLYLRDITPTSTLSLLLFGGPVSYDINGSIHSPGIVLDEWLPIRTWCKNAVLIKQLRFQLDNAIKLKLENPNYNASSKKPENHSADTILNVVEKIITNDIN